MLCSALGYTSPSRSRPFGVCARMSEKQRKKLNHKLASSLEKNILWIYHGRCISIDARVFSLRSPPPCVRERKSHHYVNWKLIIITILEFNISHTAEKRKNVKFRSLNSVLSCIRRQRGHDDIMLCRSNRKSAFDRRAENENSFRAT